MFKSNRLLRKIMRFEQLNEGVWAMTYLIVDETTNEAALVDPVYDFLQHYLDVLNQVKPHPCLRHCNPHPRRPHYGLLQPARAT